MISFNQTYTDAEFKRKLQRADADWMSKLARREPDLEVDGLRPGLLQRVFGLFGGRSGQGR